MDNKFFIQCLEDYVRKDYESFIEFMKDKGFSFDDVNSFDFNDLNEDGVKSIDLEYEIEKLNGSIEDLENELNDKDYKIEELEEGLKNLRLIVEDKESIIQSLKSELQTSD